MPPRFIDQTYRELFGELLTMQSVIPMGLYRFAPHLCTYTFQSFIINSPTGYKGSLTPYVYCSPHPNTRLTRGDRVFVLANKSLKYVTHHTSFLPSYQYTQSKDIHQITKSPSSPKIKSVATDDGITIRVTPNNIIIITMQSVLPHGSSANGSSSTSEPLIEELSPLRREVGALTRGQVKVELEGDDLTVTNYPYNVRYQ